MKKLIFSAVSIFLIIVLFNTTAFAAASTNHSAITTVLGGKAKSMTKKEIKKQQKLNRKKAKLQKVIKKLQRKINKGKIDFKDPVKKWLWLALFAFVGGLLISLIGAGSLSGGLIIFGYLLYVASSIFLFIWLGKMGGWL